MSIVDLAQLPRVSIRGCRPMDARWCMVARADWKAIGRFLISEATDRRRRGQRPAAISANRLPAGRPMDRHCCSDAQDQRNQIYAALRRRRGARDHSTRHQRVAASGRPRAFRSTSSQAIRRQRPSANAIGSETICLRSSRTSSRDICGESASPPAPSKSSRTAISRSNPSSRPETAATFSSTARRRRCQTMT